MTSTNTTATNTTPNTTAGATKTFAKRFNAQRAAKAALGKDAQEGREFTTTKSDAGEWTWAAAKAASKPAKVVRKPRAANGNPLAAPDFSAKTHERYRGKLAAVVAMVEARDLAGLRAFHINPSSTSPKAIMRYRDRAIAALAAPVATDRPGDAAAIYTEENGVSFERALVACNMD